MRWCKILSQHDMRSAEAYPYGYGEVRRVSLMARRLHQIAPTNFGFRVKPSEIYLILYTTAMSFGVF